MVTALASDVLIFHSTHNIVRCVVLLAQDRTYSKLFMLHDYYRWQQWETQQKTVSNKLCNPRVWCNCYALFLIYFCRKLKEKRLAEAKRNAQENRESEYTQLCNQKAMSRHRIVVNINYTLYSRSDIQWMCTLLDGWYLLYVVSFESGRHPKWYDTLVVYLLLWEKNIKPAKRQLRS